MTYAKKKFKDMFGDKEIKYQDIWRGKARLVTGVNSKMGSDRLNEDLQLNSNIQINLRYKVF